MSSPDDDPPGRRPLSGGEGAPDKQSEESDAPSERTASSDVAPSETGTSGIGTSGIGTSGTGTSGIGTSGIGTSGTGTSGIGTSGTGTSVSGTLSTSDDAILPSGVDGNDALRDAVGVKARRRRPADEDGLDDRFDGGDDGEPPGRRRGRRTTFWAALSIIAGLSIATLVFLGRANAQRYLLVCSSARVTAEQGRGFPPWGSHPMAGPEWKPIALPADAECKPRETDDASELGKWYLDLLIERATITLTARNLLESIAAPPGAQPTNPLDTVAEQLDQALLLARDPDRRDQRKEIQRLLGDVEYWRASARLREASAVLLDAAKQFDTAAAQRPRHVSDAAAWATFLRKVTDELHSGPGGAPAPQVPTTAGSNAPVVTAPPGVALPVEPDKTSSGSAAPPPAPDAGVPAGGVLL